MSYVTTTIVKVPKIHIVAFGGESAIRERWGDNISIDKLEELEKLGADELVSFTVFNTKDYRLADVLGEVFPDCMVVVEDRDNCGYSGWLYRGGSCVFDYTDKYDAEDDEDEDVLVATENRVWEKLKEAWDTTRDIIVIDLPADKYFDDIRKAAKIDTVAKAVKCANDSSSQNHVAIACMKFVADVGKKNDIEKLLRFYVEETDAGDPEPPSAGFRIINKGDVVLYNEIPGNVYDLQEKEIDGFTPKGRKPSSVCIESEKEYLLTENLCKRRISHRNLPSWLKIEDRLLDILCVEPTKSLSGKIGGWNICKKIICNGKEFPYFIIGRDRRGDMWAPYGSMILCAESPGSLPLMNDSKYFTYSWWDGSGDKMENVRLMRESLKIDLNKLSNTYELNSILHGFTFVDGIDQDNVRSIKSFIIDGDKGIITLADGNKIDIVIK